jgi:hypothetical protein
VRRHNAVRRQRRGCAVCTNRGNQGG